MLGTLPLYTLLDISQLSFIRKPVRGALLLVRAELLEEDNVSNDSPMLDRSIVLFRAGSHDSLSVHIHDTNLGVFAIEDLCDFLERGALGLDIQEIHKDEFEGDPAL